MEKLVGLGRRLVGALGKLAGLGGEAVGRHGGLVGQRGEQIDEGRWFVGCMERITRVLRTRI